MADAAGRTAPGAKAAEPAAESATGRPRSATPMPETPPATALALSDALIEPLQSPAAGLNLSASEQSELTSIIGFINQMTLEEKLFCLRS